ncbi:hypothetical protein PLICRDRAFT_52549 [Plicaturopsis crispa FD-325 SS-3]|nr:hypothetical protein PLICRDRAFT_52549 [Plicaturopsis crispa FD-325 SS-3]
MLARVSLLAVVASVASLVSAANASELTYPRTGTFFAPGTGACGIFNTEADSIVAVSNQFFSTFPGATANPNANPVCGKQIQITFGGKTVPATITDRCAGCAGEFDLDMSPAVFNQLADPAVGRIQGVSWVLV